MAASITKMYALGSNGAGQLGVGHLDDVSSPQLCTTFVDPSETGNRTGHSLQVNGIRKVVAGGNHTVVLTVSGVIYAAGNNSDGRCGAPATLINQTEFLPIVLTGTRRNITDVAASWEATFFVEDSRRIFVCGSGLKGELGLGENVMRSEGIQLVLDVDKIGSTAGPVSSIACGMDHVVVLLSNGQVLGWGRSRKGQLGSRLRDRKVIWSPELLDLAWPVAQVATGREYTLLVDHVGRCQLLGECKHFTRLVPDISLTAKVYSSWTAVIVKDAESLVGFGRDDRGQLPPPDLGPVTAYAAGSEHSVAKLGDGTIAAWGWGEHGNCGHPVDARSNVVGHFNRIATVGDISETVVGVGAGCATTFFWTVADG